ncbi:MULTISPECIES: fluoride efflux transporter FluC [Prochlorococcus]|uniref:fluoride efflux transporter FluC n=1 Tax=Prochlorococcus TaxID=1218 RepID=UPI0007B3D7DE|nr:MULTISPECIES: CrcB family protein [Prochlorococcus]KZR66204.1 putative fluoride ion transporter CrcB [Prochlorococcus marinus str. MIT 1312]NMO83954.1 CrcB family protein [Prochlorococcus sp. P1344]NMP05506.1 CrcB family protein [Prochlorococcus sp. P1361]NMP13084.1 CrcB family protein [Prochlorococcus sp.P1363]
MSDLELPGWQASLVAIGAVPGAWLRLRLVNHLAPMVPRKHWGTFTVNMVAAFALGLVLALQAKYSPASGASPLILLLGVGFFGSLSTFSTFTVEVLNTLREHRWSEALVLAVGSILGGLLAVAAGVGLANG